MLQADKEARLTRQPLRCWRRWGIGWTASCCCRWRALLPQLPRWWQSCRQPAPSVQRCQGIWTTAQTNVLLLVWPLVSFPLWHLGFLPYLPSTFLPPPPHLFFSTFFITAAVTVPLLCHFTPALISLSPWFSCGRGDQAAECILQHCPSTAHEATAWVATCWWPGYLASCRSWKRWQHSYHPGQNDCVAVITKGGGGEEGK